MENCIFNDRDETVGYYKDIKAGLEKQGKEFIDSGDYEQAQECCDILLDLEKYRENERLLVLSENNGMGWTISEYK